MNRNFRAFTDLKSLEPEVPMICLVTGGVVNPPQPLLYPQITSEYLKAILRILSLFQRPEISVQVL
jgi:hypothetical protein